MNDQENRPSNPEPPAPPKTDVWLPPRLRDRLEESQREGGGWEPPKQSKAGIIVLAVIAAAVIGGVAWLVSANKAKEAKAAATAKAEQARLAQVEADSLARVKTADSLLAVARAESIATFMKLPKWRQDQLHGIATPGIANPEEKGSFVIDAGEFLFEDPAKEAAEGMKGKTKLDVRVVPVGESFHVYVGKFSSRGAAQEAANGLLGKGIANQANVISAK